MHKTFMFFVIMLGLNSNGFCETIEVSSNADQGAGTLREALTRAAANGTNDIDYIHFNLSGTTDADRSITINTPLPALSTNLVIDGTTQPGASFGVTNARVKILCDNTIITNPDPILKGTAIGGLEIYGLWFEHLNEYEAENGALSLKDCAKVLIGAPGKGNYFKRNGIIGENIMDFTFQSNICFTDETGSLASNSTSRSTGQQIRLIVPKKVLIGGSAETGNLIAGSIDIDGYIYHVVGRKDIEVSYNNMGASFDRSHSGQDFLILRPRIQIAGSYNNGQPRYDDHQILIKNNIITACNAVSALIIGTTSGTVTIQGNGFNTDLEGALDYSAGNFNSGGGIMLRTKAECLVGGKNPGEGNIIRSQTTAIYNSNQPEGTIEVSRNRMYCISTTPYSIGVGLTIPVVAIISDGSGELRGTATRLSTVDLYYDDGCDGCTPETYFTSVDVGSDGRWYYGGPVNGAVIACATIGKQTSVFTKAVLKMDNLIITPSSCGLNNGKISGIVSENSQQYLWLNEQNEVVGTALNVENLNPGRYKLFVGSGTCQASSQYITVYDATPVFNDQNLSKVQPACGLSNGSISDLLVSIAGPETLTYAWYNQNNVKVGDAMELAGVPAGSYTLMASGPDGCAKPYGPVVLSNQDDNSGLTIDEQTVKLTDEDCAYNNGSITGIIVSGASSIVWLNEEGRPSGTTVDLVNAKAGIYRLIITSANGCTKESNPFKIKGPVRPEYRLTAKVVNISCSTNLGSVEIINEGGDEPLAYRWEDANGNPVGEGIKLEAVAGTYTLYLTDPSSCGEHIYALYPIVDQIGALASPQVNDLKVIGAGPVLIQVLNPEQGNYFLYDALGREIAQSINGVFNVTLPESTSFSIRLRNGDCESPLVVFNVMIERAELLKIANSFSPNGDGENDSWVIPALVDYPEAVVTVVNRQGITVFKSKGYQLPFEGKYHGADLPVGVYYYLIDLKQGGGIRSGSLALIR